MVGGGEVEVMVVGALAGVPHILVDQEQGTWGWKWG